MDAVVSAKQAAHRVGLKYALLDAWARAGIVSPRTPGGSQGKRREYVLRDLIALRVANELRLIGVRTFVVRAAVEYIQNDAAGLDTVEAVRRHRGLWLGVTCLRGKVVEVVSAVDPSKLRPSAGSIAVLVDVIAVAMRLTGSGRVLRLPQRRR